MPEPPPVITATWRASDFSFDLPSLACSSDQYSTSNMSYSLMLRYSPIASASVMTAMAFSAMSAAMAASLALPPTPNMPTPGTRITRGSGSSSFFFTGLLALLSSK